MKETLIVIDLKAGVICYLRDREQLTRFWAEMEKIPLAVRHGWIVRSVMRHA